MRNNIVSTFYSDYSTLLKKFDLELLALASIRQHYESTGLQSLLDSGNDLGSLVKTHPKLGEFFGCLKTCGVGILDILIQHRRLKGYYDTLDLVTLIGDSDDLGNGVLGSELKVAIEAMASLDGDLTSGSHYPSLCQLRHTGPRLSLSHHADWESGITGATINSAMTSLAELDDFMSSVPESPDGKVLEGSPVTPVTSTRYSSIYKLL
jgi:hypothetical protein